MAVTGPQLEAALYDWECEQFLRRQLGDVAFYDRDLPGRLLELACGTGRVTAGLLARGRDVTGLDVHPGMLARARARLGDRVRLVQADMRTFDLGERFDGLLLPYNSFQILLDPRDQLRCLERVRAHLEPGGRFALEITPFRVRDHASDWVHRATAPLAADSDVMVTVHQRVRHEPTEPITHYDARFTLAAPGDSTVHERTLTLRTYRRDELERLLERAEFEVVAVAGDYDGTPLGPRHAESMLFVARSA